MQKGETQSAENSPMETENSNQQPHCTENVGDQEETKSDDSMESMIAKAPTLFDGDFQDIGEPEENEQKEPGTSNKHKNTKPVFLKGEAVVKASEGFMDWDD